jgi:hypothetical protein
MAHVYLALLEQQTKPVMILRGDPTRRVMSRTVVRTNVSRTMLVSHVMLDMRMPLVMMRLDPTRRVMSRTVVRTNVS